MTNKFLNDGTSQTKVIPSFIKNRCETLNDRKKCKLLDLSFSLKKKMFFLDIVVCKATDVKTYY